MVFCWSRNQLQTVDYSSKRYLQMTPVRSQRRSDVATDSEFCNCRHIMYYFIDGLKEWIRLGDLPVSVKTSHLQLISSLCCSLMNSHLYKWVSCDYCCCRVRKHVKRHNCHGNSGKQTTLRIPFRSIKTGERADWFAPVQVCQLEPVEHFSCHKGTSLTQPSRRRNQLAAL